MIGEDEIDELGDRSAGRRLLLQPVVQRQIGRTERVGTEHTARPAVDRVVAPQPHLAMAEIDDERDRPLAVVALHEPAPTDARPPFERMEDAQGLGLVGAEKLVEARAQRR